MMSSTAEQLSFAFELFEEEMISPVGGEPMSELEKFIASLLFEAASDRPLKTNEIVAAVADSLDQTLNFRRLKLIIKRLRDDRGFPILTRRSKPEGYYWCRSEAEFTEFRRMWWSQILSEINTIEKMTKRTYPHLAGQMRLVDIPQN